MDIYELPLEMLNLVTKFKITITGSILRQPISGNHRVGNLVEVNFSKESKTVQGSFKTGEQDISGKL